MHPAEFHVLSLAGELVAIILNGRGLENSADAAPSRQALQRSGRDPPVAPSRTEGTWLE